MKKTYQDYQKLLKDKGNLLRLREADTPNLVLKEVIAGTEKDVLCKKLKLSDLKLDKYLMRLARKIKKADAKNMTNLAVQAQASYSPITSNTFNVQEEMQKLIPSKDGYIPRSLYGTTDVKLLETLYDNRNNNKIIKKYPLIIGPTGCGKTHLFRNLAYKLKVPYQRLNLNGGTTAEDLSGQWEPNPNPGGAKYIWVDGWLSKIMRYGGILVLDEVNMAPADILSLLNSVTDDEKKLVLTQKGGEVLIAHPNFWIAFTMNPVDYEGTKPINQALKDRLKIIYQDYSLKVEEKLGIDNKMLEVADKLRKSEEILTPVSTRDLLDYMGEKEVSGDKAARAYFINNFSEEEQQLVNEILELILDGVQKAEDITNLEPVEGVNNGTN